MSSRDDMAKVLQETLKLLDEVAVPTELRVAAFERTFDALVSRRASSEQSNAKAGLGAGTNAEPLLGIAERLGLEHDLVREIYVVEDDEVSLVIPPSRFEKSKAVGAQQVALLTAAGRQGAGLEEWTHIKVIREACREYGRLDSANFATTIKRMDGVFSYRGRAQQLEVRLTRPGYEQAGVLARELRGY